MQASGRGRCARPAFKAWMITVPVDFATVAATAVFVPDHARAFLSMGALCVLLLHSEGRYSCPPAPEHPRRPAVAARPGPDRRGHRSPPSPRCVTPVPTSPSCLRWATVAVGLLVLGRMTTTAALRAARRRRIISRPTLVVGGGPLGVELVKILDRYPQYGLRVAGIVDDRDIHEIDGGDEPVHGMVRLGRLSELRRGGAAVARERAARRRPGAPGQHAARSRARRRGGPAAT